MDMIILQNEPSVKLCLVRHSVLRCLVIVLY